MVYLVYLPEAPATTGRIDLSSQHATKVGVMLVVGIVLTTLAGVLVMR
ncbi:hypothetical protein QTQ03_07660 [Micromonospora sp. WMMA1363]|nr:hypothetical protein [Micromonospora sp. WMMA1363]MDM4719479.1 hypothetical protein [Micromonospora sp. WMMA1363]